MGYLLLHIFFSIAIVSHHVAIVDCCSCLQPDPYEGICESDFAINATVLTKHITNPDRNAYDVQYELDIHNVFTSDGADADSVPNVLKSSGLCALSLKVDATYILTGPIIDDKNTGNKVLATYWCNLHQYVTGDESVDSKFEEAEDLVNSVDCSDNPNYSKIRSSGKRDQKARSQAVRARTKQARKSQR